MNETRYAGVAQLVEQLICNQQVGGSSPSTSSTIFTSEYGRFPEWPKGADCKSVVNDFGGSNPPPPTKRQSIERCSVFVLLSDFSRSSGFESRLLATCWMHVATGVAFPQKSESTTSHQETEYRKMLCFCFGRRTKAFLSEEGGTAQAVTEGAARGQVCTKANLMRISPICKTPSVFAAGRHMISLRRNVKWNNDY